MNPAELTRAIDQGRIPPVLFLYGEETFTLERTLGRLCRTVVADEARDFNFDLFHGRECRAQAILDAARTFPVFAPRRLILIKDAHLLPAAEGDELLPYVKAPLAETVVVFVGDKIDQRKKFFLELKKHGELVEFKKLYDNQIPAFVQQMSKELGKSLTEDGLALFCRRVGNNLQEVHGELVKLAAYLGSEDLADASHVAAVVSDTRVESVFELTDALGHRDCDKALRILGRLLDDGTVPLVILTMMARHFRQLWKLRELLDQGTKRGDIPRLLGINPYFLDGLLAQARSFTPTQGRKIFELMLGVDLALKSSGAHGGVLLETLVLHIGREPAA
ncbi:MAG: DNA polymerase III subunit delta [Desulfuromonadales bacterium GWD2_61_12]|nr:MAG: DNA polymerase III subunit delta [Desulfuromonadales bacterium GWC2_61_20]OGR33720.1 MAG: DNA polymerase III subunit delta [Desulfuromonadales bacterium GWD2_61_12]